MPQAWFSMNSYTLIGMRLHDKEEINVYDCYSKTYFPLFS